VKTLVLLKCVTSSVEAIIFSDNIGKGLHTLEYQDFYREYSFRNRAFKNPVESFMTDILLLLTGIPNINKPIIVEHLLKMQDKELRV